MPSVLITDSDLNRLSISYDEEQLKEISAGIKLAMGKEMGVGCPESCRNRCRDKFHNIERLRAFTSFWTLGSKKHQQEFLEQHVYSLPVHGRTVSGDSPRTRTLNYTFNVEGSRLKVCKTMFLQTLAVSEKTVRNVMRINS